MSSLLSKVKAGFWRLSMKGLPRGPHVTRYSMYKRLAKTSDKFPSRAGNVLSISHSSSLCKHLNIQPDTLVEANYPEHNILKLNFASSAFDFILLDQVLEHIEGNPQQAIDECWRVLRPGGIMVLTTCFIYPVHGYPSDYWRFTPAALRLLCKEFASIIECDSWGNFETWLLIRDGLQYEGIPHATWHPLHRLATQNDPEWPIVTWIVAQK